MVLCVDFALPAQATAHRQALAHARDAVAGEQLGGGLRHVGQQPIAQPVVRDVAGHAGGQLPAGAQRARGLHLHPARAGARHRFVSLRAIGRQRIGDGHGQVVLPRLVHRGGQVELVAPERALGPQLKAVARLRVQIGAAHGAVALRLEDAGVVGIGRPVRAQVHHQAQVGRDLARLGPVGDVDAAGAVGEVGLVAAPVRHARPGQHGHAVHGLEAGGGKGAVHALVRLVVAHAGVIGRSGAVAIPGVDVGHRAAPVVVPPVGVRGVAEGGAAHLRAQGQVVRAAQQRVGAGGLHVQAVLGGLGRPAARPDGDARPRGPVGVAAAGVAHQFVVMALRAAGRGAQLPVARQAVLQRGKHAVVVPLGIRPAGRCRGRTTPLRARAIGVVSGQATARMALGIVVLQRCTGTQQRAGRQVGLQHAVQQLLALVQAIDVRVVILRRSHQPPAQRACLVQRATHIGLQAAQVPRARLGLHLGLKVLRGPLANHIDGGPRCAQAIHQARGAPHHFHPVEHGHVVGLEDRGVVGVELAHAVHHVGVHLKAARVDGR